MVEHDFPVILFMPPGKALRDLKKVLNRLCGLGAETLVICSAEQSLPAATRTLRVPGSTPEIFTPIPYIVPGQILAALLAEVKGINPDKPRSLRIVTHTI